MDQKKYFIIDLFFLNRDKILEQVCKRREK